VKAGYISIPYLEPTIIPELKLEQAVIAMRTGINQATGPIVFRATLYVNTRPVAIPLNSV